MLAGAMLLLIVFVGALEAPRLSPHDPQQTDMNRRLRGASREFPLGTDHLGRDLLSRVLYGARVSIGVGLLAVTVSFVGGTVSGIVSGYYGGPADELIMRAMDVLLSFPALMLALALVAVLGPSLLVVAVVIGVVRMPSFARVTRSDVLALREQEFIAAARALGQRDRRILIRHVLPNVVPQLIVMASLLMAQAVTLEASMSFLGLGVPPPHPSLGSIVSDGREFIRQAPHISTYGGLAIALLVLGFNLVGDAVRDIMDPRLVGSQ